MRLMRSRGSAFVELALCMPVLALIMMGVTDYGRIFSVSVSLSSAAWAGGAYASSSSANYNDAAGITAAVNSLARDIAPVTTTTSTYCQCGGGTVSCTATCTPMKQYVSIKVRKDFSTWFQYPALPKSVPLQETILLRVR